MMNRGLRHRSAGFTLVEMIIVMTLLAVLAAVAAPRLAGFISGRYVDEECRRFIAMTQYARDTAVSRGESVKLTIAAGGTSYDLAPVAAGVTAPKTEFPAFECQQNLWFEAVTETPEENATAATITFWPDGAIDEASPSVVRLMEGDAVAYTITLDANRLEYKAERGGSDVVE